MSYAVIILTVNAMTVKKYIYTYRVIVSLSSGFDQLLLNATIQFLLYFGKHLSVATENEESLPVTGFTSFTTVTVDFDVLSSIYPSTFLWEKNEKAHQ